MLNPRTGLILAGLTFATWEAVDIFWISFPAAAAVFAALFLGSTVGFWHRNSLRAAVVLAALFAVEGAVAPTLRAMTVTKVADFTLALAGLLLAITVLARWRSRRPLRAAGARRAVRPSTEP